MPRLLISFLALLTLPLSAADFYVAPDAPPSGDGSTDRPWNLQTALSHPPILRPGDTILLRPGAYRGGFTSSLAAFPDAPITVRPAPGARVTIDTKPRDEKDSGAFTVNGHHALFRDLEFTCSDEKRRTELAGSFPADIRRGSVTINGAHIKFINCIVHDLSNGFGFWSAGEGGEIYGCLIYNNGWLAPDRGHGHGIYAQNKTGTKRIIDNIIFHQFSHGIHAYGSSRAFLNGFHLEGNIAFNNGALAGPAKLAPDILVGGGAPSERIALISNSTFSTDSRGVVRLGYGAENQDLLLKDNYFADRIEIRKWRLLTAQNNTLVGQPSLSDIAQIDGRPIASSPAPHPPHVVIRPNQHQPGRAHIAIYNWDLKDSIQLDLKPILKPAQRYRIVHAADFYGPPIASGIFDSNPVSIPLKPARISPPVGMPDSPLRPTEPRFTALVLLPAD